MENRSKAIIVMKVGPHSDMPLVDIIVSKKEEEKIHGVHYWGYSGVFCQPKATKDFCEWAIKNYGEEPYLILIETKSSYKSNIGMITQYSKDNKIFEEFVAPVQLQGAQFSFVAKEIEIVEEFDLNDYIVVGGKNDGKILSQHLRYRVNKAFAKLKPEIEKEDNMGISEKMSVLRAKLVYPYAIWLKE